jgi:type II secretory pathway predicted ATPase ExeA
LAYSIEQAERQVVFRAEAGLGKTTVLRRAFEETRSPRRQFALLHSPSDRTELFGLLAQRFGQSLGRQSTWRAVARAIRVASLQDFQVVVAIDGWDDRLDHEFRHDLDALTHLGLEDRAQLTVIRVAQTRRDPQPESGESWTLAIGLRHLTRSQLEVYLTAKLVAAGCGETIFTPRALTRLHSLSRGVPRGIERLATLSLMAGAVRGLEVISPEVVDGVAPECSGAAPRVELES